jgi:predicted transcriptional regulator
MARTPHDVTDTELAILQVLWERGPATRRQITDALYPEGSPAQYATVQKLLDRLEAKGYATRQRGDGILTFRATLDREQLISQRLRDMAEKLCGGSLTPLLMNLVRVQPLSAAEVDELQQLLKELSGPNRRKGGRS